MKWIIFIVERSKRSAKGRRFQSITAKTVAPLILAAALISIGLTSYNLVTGHRLLQEQVQLRAQHLANAVQYLIEVDPRRGKLIRLVNSLGGEQDTRLILFASIDNNNVLACSENAWIGRSVEHLINPHSERLGKVHMSDEPMFYFDDALEEYVYLMPIGYYEYNKIGIRRGVVYVVLEPSLGNAQLEQRYFQIVILFAAFSGLSVIAVLLIRRYIQRPVFQMLQAMEERREVNPHARSPVDTDDEIGDLSRQYNQTLDALFLAEERFQQLANNTKDVFWVRDLSTEQVHYVNYAFEMIWGFSREKLYARPDSWLDSILGEEKALVTAAWKKAREQGGDFRLIYRIVSLDGTEKWIEDNGIPVMDQDGYNYRMVGIARDITNQKRAEKAYIAAKDQAERLARSRSEFLANMSHEIRTPLNGILGAGELLLTTKVDTEQGELGNLITHSCRSLLAVINDILDLSKIQAGKMAIEKISFVPRQLIQDVHSLLASSAHTKSLAFELVLPDEGPQYLLGDPIRIRQILVNLVGNALKFTNEGFVKIELQMKHLPEETGEAWDFCVAVADTGIGIPKEKQTVIFQSFSQADSSTTRQYGGTGLGLSISLQLAEQMGGKLFCESEPDVGSTFTLCLPLQVSHKRYMRRDKTLKNLKRNYQKRVLLAEDNLVNQKVACKMLSRFGVEVIIAQNGKEALDVLQEERDFDMILMDMQMPLLDGLEATRQIRLEDSETPIVAMTANVLAEDRQLCLSAGMNDYLSKPIKVAELVKVLDHYLVDEPVEH